MSQLASPVGGDGCIEVACSDAVDDSAPSFTHQAAVAASRRVGGVHCPIGRLLRESAGHQPHVTHELVAAMGLRKSSLHWYYYYYSPKALRLIQQMFKCIALKDDAGE